MFKSTYKAVNYNGIKKILNFVTDFQILNNCQYFKRFENYDNVYTIVIAYITLLFLNMRACALAEDI